MNIAENVKELDIIRNYHGGWGFFGIKIPATSGYLKQYIKWYSCREEWASCGSLGEFVYCHESKTIEDVAGFIWKLEKILSFSVEIEPTTFYRIKTNGILDDDKNVWVETSKFWLAQHMRYSLFTACLRSVLEYDHTKGNFFDALFKGKYTSSTREAIFYFLDGNVNYKGCLNGKKDGWHHEFWDKKLDMIKTVLTK